MFNLLGYWIYDNNSGDVVAPSGKVLRMLDTSISHTKYAATALREYINRKTKAKE